VRAAPTPATEEPPLIQRAPLTFGIIAVNLAVFAAQTYLAGLAGLASMPAYVLLAVGANNVNATLYEHHYETLLTSCFVHGSLLHIAFNMVALRQIGPVVEGAVGARRMAPLYLLSGIAGSLGSTYWVWRSGGQALSVGASGAICGLIGAALVLGYRIEGKRSPLMWTMARWLLTLFVLGAVVNFLVRLGGQNKVLDNASHFAGALAGASIAIAWKRGNAASSEWSAAVVIGCTALVTLAGIVAGVRTATNPFATMTVDDRVAFATSAIDEGRCLEARAAVQSLKRLAPQATEVVLVEQNFRHRCGR
jgi:rhomboid protease GluP